MHSLTLPMFVLFKFPSHKITFLKSNKLYFSWTTSSFPRRWQILWPRMGFTCIVEPIIIQSHDIYMVDFPQRPQEYADTGKNCCIVITVNKAFQKFWCISFVLVSMKIFRMFDLQGNNIAIFTTTSIFLLWLEEIINMYNMTQS